MARFSELSKIAGPSSDRPPFRFAAAQRVAFSDTDAQGIVYYGRYAPYFDAVRVEYMRHLGLDSHTWQVVREAAEPDAADPAQGDFVMRHFEIDYHAPAVFDDALEVFCRVIKLGNSSMTFEYAVTRPDGDLLLATSTQVMVFVDLAQRRPMRIPEALREPIRRFEDLP